MNFGISEILFVVVCICICVFLWRRKKKKYIVENNNSTLMYEKDITILQNVQHPNVEHEKGICTLQGGKYKILRHIASGGFGNTYEALDVSLNKKVAIKEFFVKDFCTRDSNTTSMTVTAINKAPLIKHLKKKFIEEARAIAKMEHDNIIKVHALFEENDTAYYVMDYVEGESLSNILKNKGPLSEKEAIPIIQKVASALGYMHKQNIYHLDVKPANIMLRNDGKVLLIDFGSSKQYTEVGGEDTTTITPCYTPGYAPLEQLNTKPTTFTAATDIYALGATLYKMLTGITPPSAIELMSGDEEMIALPMTISKNVRKFVEKAMIPQRNKRLQSAEEVMSLLALTPTDNDNKRTDFTKILKNNEETVLVVKKKKNTDNAYRIFLKTVFFLGFVYCFAVGSLFLVENISNKTIKSYENYDNCCNWSARKRGPIYVGWGFGKTKKRAIKNARTNYNINMSASVILIPLFSILYGIIYLLHKKSLHSDNISYLDNSNRFLWIILWLSMLCSLGLLIMFQIICHWGKVPEDPSVFILLGGIPSILGIYLMTIRKRWGMLFTLFAYPFCIILTPITLFAMFKKNNGISYWAFCKSLESK